MGKGGRVERWGGQRWADGRGVGRAEYGCLQQEVERLYKQLNRGPRLAVADSREASRGSV